MADWNAEVNISIRKVKELIREANQLLIEVQLLSDFNDFRDTYQNKVTDATKTLRSIVKSL